MFLDGGYRTVYRFTGEKMDINVAKDYDTKSYYYLRVHIKPIFVYEK